MECDQQMGITISDKGLEIRHKQTHVTKQIVHLKYITLTYDLHVISSVVPYTQLLGCGDKKYLEKIKREIKI